MNNHQTIVERLSLFNNRSFTKKQWEIILIGCGCPKSTYFWSAFRDNNLFIMSGTRNKVYTMADMDSKAFSKIWEEYCINNRKGAKKAYDKAKARKKVDTLKGHTFYMVGGVLTTEIPERDT